jgi:hypothetical protein
VEDHDQAEAAEERGTLNVKKDACRKHFALRHPNSERIGGVGRHPNSYFDCSMIYKEKKGDGVPSKGMELEDIGEAKPKAKKMDAEKTGELGNLTN